MNITISKPTDGNPTRMKKEYNKAKVAGNVIVTTLL
jgi:hypothetical protein